MSCLLMMAHATRAVLFAKATAATSFGFRLSRDINQRSVLACFEQSSTILEQGGAGHSLNSANRKRQNHTGSSSDYARAFRCTQHRIPFHPLGSRPPKSFMSYGSIHLNRSVRCQISASSGECGLKAWRCGVDLSQYTQQMSGSF